MKKLSHFTDSANLNHAKKASGNYSKHTTKNPLQRWLIHKFHDNVVYLIRKTSTNKLLEAGCGEGFSSKEILFSGDYGFVGIDIDFDKLFLAQINCPTGSFLQSDIFFLPFSDRSFDLVIGLEVLEHLDDPFSALIELCRVSRGWLILSVPNEPFFCLANFFRGKNLRTYGNDPEHINHWTKKSFVDFVARKCKVKECIFSFPWIILLSRIR